MRSGTRKRFETRQGSFADQPRHGAEGARVRANDTQERTMKVRAITPIRVGNEELQRRQARYDRLAPDGWQITVEDLPAAGPAQLGSREDIERSEAVGVAAALGPASAGFDAVMSDCVLDPGLAQLEAHGGTPVVGLTRLSAMFLASLGVRFGVVTRNQTIAAEFAETVNRYGVGDSFGGAYVLDLSVEDIADTARWNAAILAAAESAKADAVSVLLNGCSAVEVTIVAAGVTVVDPTALALKVASLGVNEGLLGFTDSK